MKCDKMIIRRGKEVPCLGTVLEIKTVLNGKNRGKGRVEIDHVCDTCGKSVDLSQTVARPVSL